MKHFFRDCVVYLVDVCGVSALYRFFVRRNGALVRIVVFHDVDDALWFEDVLLMFTSRYHLITPEELHLKKFHPIKINLLLTFDDGYDSWVTICLPLLKKYAVKGLFFISSGILETERDTDENARFMRERLSISPKVPLSWEGVGSIEKEGHSFGGHTHSHPNLASLPLGAAREEIVKNKQILEQKISTEIVDFAYPFGTKEHRSDFVFALLSEVGYTSVHTAISGFVLAREKQPEIPRMCIEKNQSIQNIVRWVEGGYDVFCFITRKL
jgi:peptidoglycan/xylan/chitin deacetylase (PgdA/CDA1 family)